jgi:hypothetical protein
MRNKNKYKYVILEIAKRKLVLYGGERNINNKDEAKAVTQHIK